MLHVVHLLLLHATYKLFDPIGPHIMHIISMNFLSADVLSVITSSSASDVRYSLYTCTKQRSENIVLWYDVNIASKWYWVMKPGYRMMDTAGERLMPAGYIVMNL